MSEPVWGILIAADLFFGGIAGGAYLTGAWSDLFVKERYRVLAKSGAYTSLIAILAGLVFLILDLKRLTVAPFSIINANIHFPVSMISIGTWIVTAFAIVSFLTTILWLLDGNRILIKLLEIIGMVLGFSTTAYTYTPLLRKRKAFLEFSIPTLTLHHRRDPNRSMSSCSRYTYHSEVHIPIGQELR